VRIEILPRISAKTSKFITPAGSYLFEVSLNGTGCTPFQQVMAPLGREMVVVGDGCCWECRGRCLLYFTWDVKLYSPSLICKPRQRRRSLQSRKLDYLYHRSLCRRSGPANGVFPWPIWQYQSLLQLGCNA
jgi:hypothetical protein